MCFKIEFLLYDQNDGKYSTRTSDPKENCQVKHDKINLRLYSDCHVDIEEKSRTEQDRSTSALSSVVFGSHHYSDILKNQKKNDHISVLKCLSSYHVPLVQISVDSVQKKDGSSASLNVRFLITVISSCI